MPKYAFCDLDYTLLTTDKKISKNNLDAIDKFIEKGNKFIMCSGRVPFALNEYKVLLNASDIVSSNGGVIISNNKIIKKSSLSKDVLKKIIDYAIAKDRYLRIFSIDCMYILNFPKDKESQGFVYKEHKFVDHKEIYDLIENVEILKIVCSSAFKDVLSQITKEIKDLNLNLETCLSAYNFLEFNNKGENKGNGIIDYCKLNNIDINDTIAIGDNENDISMFKVAGYNACPSNAIDEIKELSDYISDKDNDEDAVKDILEKFL